MEDKTQIKNAMTEKEIFIEGFKKRTRKFGADVILFCNSLIKSQASSVVIYQLVKAATSTGANYRAACRGRSKAEFYSKICIVVEEADESEFWLELILEAKLSNNLVELTRLTKEANEITKVVTKAKHSSYGNSR